MFSYRRNSISKNLTKETPGRSQVLRCEYLNKRNQKKIMRMGLKVSDVDTYRQYQASLF